MTATTLIPPTPTTVRPARATKLLRTGATAGVAAGVATTAVAGVADAAGVSLHVSGSAIPIIGFGNLTFVFVMVGALIAVACAHFARRPRRTFLVTTLVLTALSFVPDVTADAQLSTKLVLMLTHVVAAAIAIPALASRFTD